MKSEMTGYFRCPRFQILGFKKTGNVSSVLPFREQQMNAKEPIPYKEAYPAGSEIRIADRPSLEQFMATWKYHHKLKPEQLAFADRVVRVVSIGFYHGGDPVYKLEGVPGDWLEQCLLPSSQAEGDGPLNL
jgi:hypothetical protein